MVICTFNRESTKQPRVIQAKKTYSDFGVLSPRIQSTNLTVCVLSVLTDACSVVEAVVLLLPSVLAEYCFNNILA